MSKCLDIFRNSIIMSCTVWVMSFLLFPFMLIANGNLELKDSIEYLHLKNEAIENLINESSKRFSIRDTTYKMLLNEALLISDSIDFLHYRSLINARKVFCGLSIDKERDFTALLLAIKKDYKSISNAGFKSRIDRNLGQIEWLYNRPDLAILHYTNAADNARLVKSNTMLSRALMCMAEVYYWLGDHESAKSKFQEALALSKSLKQPRTAFLSTSFLIEIYLSDGDTAKAQKQVQLLQKWHSNESIELTKENLVWIDYKLASLSNNPKVFRLLEKDIQNRRYEFSKASGWIEMGDLYVGMNNIDSALSAYLKAFNILVNGKDLRYQLPEVSQKISNIYDNKGDVSRSHFYLKRAIQAQEAANYEGLIANLKELEIELRNKKNQEQIEGLELENQLKELSIKQQKRFRYLWSALALISIAFAGFLLVGYRQRARQNKILKIQGEKLEKSLEERESLVKEMHHRVKNNLQVISGLLKWQSSFLKHNQAKDAFDEGRARIESMTLIHQSLYMQDRLTSINMQEYIEKLCDSLLHTYSSEKQNVTIDVNVQKVDLDVECVVPLGLILNELLTNALKHAFDFGKDGIIKVKLNREDAGLKLEVIDNGVGMKSEIGRNNASFGWELIETFTKKLKGEIAIKVDGGTHVTIKNIACEKINR